MVFISSSVLLVSATDFIGVPSAQVPSDAIVLPSPDGSLPSLKPGVCCLSSRFRMTDFKLTAYGGEELVGFSKLPSHWMQQWSVAVGMIRRLLSSLEERLGRRVRCII